MIEILMITHNRLEYLKKAFAGVITQTIQDWRLVIWDNGSGKETVDWLNTIKHPNVTVYFHPTNDSLASVTSTVFTEVFMEEFAGKVDADTVVPHDWAERLVAAHHKHHLGFIGGFHFKPADLDGRIPNIEDFSGVKLWRKHHIGGCSFVIRRSDFQPYEGIGVMGLSEYQAEMGLPNGYLWDPILWVDHMEDPRSEHYIRSDEYNQYKLETRGVSLDQYAGSISNKGYLDENTQ